MTAGHQWPTFLTHWYSSTTDYILLKSHPPGAEHASPEHPALLEALKTPACVEDPVKGFFKGLVSSSSEVEKGLQL